MKRVSLFGAIIIIIGLAMVIVTMTTSENPFDVGEAREEKNYTFDADDIDGDIFIDDSSADIYVSLSTDDRIHLKTFENDEEYYDITSNNDLTIIYKKDYEWFKKIIDLSILGEKSRYTLELSLPEELISNMKIDAVNCTLSIDDISVNALDIRKTNGNTDINNVLALEDITIDAVNGDIDLNHVISGKDMEFYSTNGNVTLNSIDFGGSGSIATSNGDVTADLNDRGDNYTFDISSTNGRILIEYWNVDQKGESVFSVFYGDGDKKFTVDTTNGNVEVTCEP